MHPKQTPKEMKRRLMAKIEGFWDCPYCGSKAIRGGLRTCPSCGKTRAADTKFYMHGTTPVADESAVEKGPDWFCPYCDSYNPDSETVCRCCGHLREADDRNYFQVRRDEEQKKQQADAQFASLTGNSAPAAGRAPRFGAKRFIILGLILALILTGVFLLMPKNRSLTVSSKTWERSVDIETYRLVEEDGWTLPSDAVEVLRTAQEIHHYDEILDHYEQREVQRSEQVLDGYDTYTTYEDMGNGYFESVEHETPRYVTQYYTETVTEPVYVSVPVFETKYYYSIYRWTYDRTETASGTDTEPYWPDDGLGENERSGARQEEYTVVCADSRGHETRYTCDADIWNALAVGSAYDMRVHSGEILELR